jgi:hypothetical protein
VDAVVVQELFEDFDVFVEDFLSLNQSFRWFWSRL